jgi:hypothetical protein
MEVSAMNLVIDNEFKSLVRPLTEVEFSSLEESLLVEGCRDAIVTWGDVIVDGHNRYAICSRHGIEFNTFPLEFPSRAAAKVWILKNALSRRNLTDGEKFEYALQLKEMLHEAGLEKMREGGKEGREKQLGGLSINNKPPQSESVKEEPKHDTRKEIASNLGWSPTKVAQAEVVRRTAPEKWEEVKTGAKTVGGAYTEVKSPAPKPHVAFNSGENEWYTPAKYTEAAKRVMGNIDLDPASNAVANRFVNADAFYTKEDDGLTKPWYGRVWLNPPYAQPLIAHFAEAVAGKFSSGEFEQAVVLVNNATDTKWLQSMMRVCAAVCFPEGRIRFMNQKGDPVGAPLQGQVFLYFGEDVESFLDEFASFGVVMRR